MANGGGQPHPQWRRYLFPDQIDGLYGTGMRMSICESTRSIEYAAALGDEGSVMDRALVGDQRYYLPGDMLMKTDSMSMAHGVEVRVPFLDRRIMEFANSLDGALISPLRGPDKRLLRPSRTTRPAPGTDAGKQEGFQHSDRELFARRPAVARRPAARQGGRLSRPVPAAGRRAAPLAGAH